MCYLKDDVDTLILKFLSKSSDKNGKLTYIIIVSFSLDYLKEQKCH